MNAPLVSVLMPAYNQEAFIGEAIASAVEQDYAHVQVVVTDDGSTDGTRDIIADFARRFPDRVTPVLGDHVGLPANCNRGLAECRGTYIAATSGDDVFLPGKLARQVAWFEEDPNRVLCGHDIDVFDSDTGAVRYRWTDYATLPSGRGASRLVSVGYLFPGVSLMARASALRGHRYDERFGVTCDWKFWIDVLSATNGEYGPVDGVLAKYRRHPGSITMNESTLPERLALLLGISRTVEDEHPELAADCRVYRAKAWLKLARAQLVDAKAADARRSLRSAWRSNPWSSWKIPAAFLVSLLPGAVHRPIVRRYVSPTQL